MNEIEKDNPDLYDANIIKTQPLPTPIDLIKEYPLSNELSTFIRNGRNQLHDILSGEDDRFVIIVGPCSIHDTKAGLDYAKRLKPLAEKYSDKLIVLMRVYFEKPRTTVGWKGLVYDPDLNGTFDMISGLKKARKFLLDIAEIGLLSGTEFLDPITPQYFGDLISWGAIGARTSESQTHRQLASGLSMPIGFKNGTGGSIQLAVDGIISSNSKHGFLGVDRSGKASIITTSGNKDAHLILRGGSDKPNYDKQSVSDAVTKLRDSGANTSIIIDCSHANSFKDHTKQPSVFNEIINQRISGNKNIIGLMLESNIYPGNQKLDESNPKNLEYGISITDACIEWEETEKLLEEAYTNIK
jgi:3-deoxy-7-phosphoheptulonate synthase